MASSAGPPATGPFTLSGADEAYIFSAIQNATTGGPVGPTGPSGKDLLYHAPLYCAPEKLHAGSPPFAGSANATPTCLTCLGS